jgi:biofilm PGA synthesis N-glycosyltransferase PgaC
VSLIETIFFAVFFVLWTVFFFCLTLLFHFSSKSINVKKKKIFPSVSMVVAAYNEETIIAEKLANCAELEYPKEKLQILVVDSGSTDKTRDITVQSAASLQEKVNIRLLAQEQRLGKAAALNFALGYCDRDIVILTDADVFLGKDAVTKAVSNFNDKTIGAVSGIEVVRNPNRSQTTKIEREYRGFYNTIRLGETNLDSVVMCESEFAAYRRELVEEIPVNTICDDMQLTLKVRQQGFRAIYDPSVMFYECSPSKYKSRLKHKIRRGQGNQQVLFRFANMMFRRNYGVFSSVILPFEFFIHIISPILIPICLVTYALMVISSHSIFLAAIPIVFLLASMCLVFFSRRHTLLSSGASNNPNGNGSLNVFSPLFDFITLQSCLLVSLFSLALSGPKYKWEKIEEVRTEAIAARSKSY